MLNVTVYARRRMRAAKWTRAIHRMLMSGPEDRADWILDWPAYRRAMRQRAKADRSASRIFARRRSNTRATSN